MAESRQGGSPSTYAGESLQQVTAGETSIRYDDRGLVPVVVQQVGTGEVLMVAWANDEAVRLTFSTGTSWFWSRSRRELWNKGATSGNMQQVRRVLVDCDADTLLYEVDSPGPACHTGKRSCFFRQLTAEDDAKGEC
ncbi:phosphoribosyl-AMP cyclohydrolase [Olsenella porci]|jgi:phosphoribosyl-AMP cyclohydrolase|uniref:Phosphoribosyl-AMP cyclohydrolase n=1 Tax=Olsenella porci TaxID=2652279 RepID=A0A6N7XT92_9ACTN|nr:phosphoribosyl-AMP cyclohydrolase [Olsenella porci]MST72581.1 phosphoribosyl-AMP cyclohydrolase [Olsenella porci]